MSKRRAGHEAAYAEIRGYAERPGELSDEVLTRVAASLADWLEFPLIQQMPRSEFNDLVEAAHAALEAEIDRRSLRADYENWRAFWGPSVRDAVLEHFGMPTSASQN